MRKALPWIILLLALCGIVLTSYLTWLHYNPPAPNEEILGCLTGGGCAAVNASEYSYFLGIPVALMGLVTYCIIFILSLHTLFVKENTKDAMGIIIFFLSGIGTIFQAYLTYISATIIRAYCSLCLTSELIISLIFLLSIIHYWKPLRDFWEKHTT